MRKRRAILKDYDFKNLSPSEIENLILDTEVALEDLNKRRIRRDKIKRHAKRVLRFYDSQDSKEDDEIKALLCKISKSLE